MASGRSVVAAGVGGVGVPGLFGLLLVMEAGVPVPVPGDLVMLLVGERVAAGAVPLWLAVVALELIAIIGTSTTFLLARGPGRAVLARAGPRVGLTTARLDRAAALLERRGRLALAAGRGTPGLRTVTVVTAASAGLRPSRAPRAGPRQQHLPPGPPGPRAGRRPGRPPPPRGRRRPPPGPRRDRPGGGAGRRGGVAAAAPRPVGARPGGGRGVLPGLPDRRRPRGPPPGLTRPPWSTGRFGNS